MLIILSASLISSYSSKLIHLCLRFLILYNATYLQGFSSSSSWLTIEKFNEGSMVFQYSLAAINADMNPGIHLYQAKAMLSCTFGKISTMLGNSVSSHFPLHNASIYRASQLQQYCVSSYIIAICIIYYYYYVGYLLVWQEDTRFLRSSLGLPGNAQLHRFLRIGPK